ncbi:MAG: hypothetical protein ACE5JU_20445 [Candidatus Binatia bacterium]
MGKRWVWVIAIGLVLLGGALNSAAGVTFDLTKLKSVCVLVEDLTPESAQELGLSKEAIRKYVYIWLKGKLPRLVVEQHTGAYTGACKRTAPSLWVKVLLRIGKTTDGRKTRYYGMVLINLERRTRWENGNLGKGVAYFEGSILTGPIQNAARGVNGGLDYALTDFAAEYYKAGNP